MNEANTHQVIVGHIEEAADPAGTLVVLWDNDKDAKPKDVIAYLFGARFNSAIYVGACFEMTLMPVSSSSGAKS